MLRKQWIREICAKEFEQASRCYLLLLLILGAGLAFGLAAPAVMEEQAVALCRSDISRYLSALPFQQPDYGTAFWQALLCNGGMLLLLTLSGLHLLGLPFIVFAVFLKAFAIGFTGAYLLSAKLFAGALLLLLVILPIQLILLPTFLYSAKEATILSISLWQREGIFNNRSQMIRQYLRCQLLPAGLVLITSFLQGYISPLLLLILRSVI